MCTKMDHSAEYEKLLAKTRTLNLRNDNYVLKMHPTSSSATIPVDIEDDDEDIEDEIIDLEYVDLSDEATCIFNPDFDDAIDKVEDIYQLMGQDHLEIEDDPRYQSRLLILRNELVQECKTTNNSIVDSRTFTRPKKKMNRPSLESINASFRYSYNGSSSPLQDYVANSNMLHSQDEEVNKLISRMQKISTDWKNLVQDNKPLDYTFKSDYLLPSGRNTPIRESRVESDYNLLPSGRNTPVRESRLDSIIQDQIKKLESTDSVNSSEMTSSMEQPIVPKLNMMDSVMFDSSIMEESMLNSTAPSFFMNTSFASGNFTGLTSSDADMLTDVNQPQDLFTSYTSVATNLSEDHYESLQPEIDNQTFATEVHNMFDSFSKSIKPSEQSEENKNLTFNKYAMDRSHQPEEPENRNLTFNKYAIDKTFTPVENRRLTFNKYSTPEFQSEVMETVKANLNETKIQQKPILDETVIFENVNETQVFSQPNINQTVIHPRIDSPVMTPKLSESHPRLGSPTHTSILSETVTHPRLDSPTRTSRLSDTITHPRLDSPTRTSRLSETVIHPRLDSPTHTPRLSARYQKQALSEISVISSSVERLDSNKDEIDLSNSKSDMSHNTFTRKPSSISKISMSHPNLSPGGLSEHDSPLNNSYDNSKILTHSPIRKLSKLARPKLSTESLMDNRSNATYTGVGKRSSQCESSDSLNLSGSFSSINSNRIAQHTDENEHMELHKINLPKHRSTPISNKLCKKIWASTETLSPISHITGIPPRESSSGKDRDIKSARGDSMSHTFSRSDAKILNSIETSTPSNRTIKQVDKTQPIYKTTENIHTLKDPPLPQHIPTMVVKPLEFRRPSAVPATNIQNTTVSAGSNEGTVKPTIRQPIIKSGLPRPASGTGSGIPRPNSRLPVPRSFRPLSEHKPAPPVKNNWMDGCY